MSFFAKLQHYYKEFFLKYATFTGRTSREGYWMFILGHIIVIFVLGIIDNIIGERILYSLYSIAVIIPSIAINARRMHDVGKSGWFQLIPIYNIILLLTKGDEKHNKYGNEPANLH